MSGDCVASRPFRFALDGAYRKGLFAYGKRVRMTVQTHVPVLAEAALDALAITPAGAYLDATFGRGGHAARMLAALGPAGRLYAIDRDPAAVAEARRRFGAEPRFRIWRGNFAELGAALAAMDRESGLDGILLDLGVSSPQLDDASRGFSFRDDGPLDMRMDPDTGISAADWLASVDEGVLSDVIRTLGEERFARRVARAIVRARSEAPIETTARLAQIVAGAVRSREPGKHPATRSFQAIRMAVNDELPSIEAALDAALTWLAPGGRLVVISFHSLEDRLVKRFLRRHGRPPAGNRRLPAPVEAVVPPLVEIGKAVRPDDAELAANPRARSAVMRVAEKRHAP